MRRLLAAAAIGAVVLTGAGCANEGTPTTSGTTAAPATSAAPAGADNTKEICDSLEATGKQLEKDMEGLGTAMSDPAEAQETLVKIGTAFTTFTAEIKAKSATATDPEFKAALDSAATSIDTVAKAFSDVEALQKDPTKVLEVMSDPELAKGFEGIEKHCPGLTS
jgi:hypothetical protein